MALSTGGRWPGRTPGRATLLRCRVPRKSDKFDRSISDFCQRYADQNERDYQDFGQGIQSGRLQATQGV